MKLYQIISKDGKYYRSKGYGGYGKNWVELPEKAKIFPKESSARQVISWWANRYPEFGAPNLVVLDVREEAIIQIDLKDIQRKKIKRELVRAKRTLKYSLQSYNGDAVKYQQEVDDLELALKKL